LARQSDELLRLVAIVGPTATGKTALAILLARALGGEIVSADSRQIYRRLDIGTAKPTAEERSLAPHHLIDYVEPDESYTLARYQEDAYRVIAEIRSRGRLPLLVGGTGLYVRAVLEGLTIPKVPPQADVRAELERRAKADGPIALHAELARLDPVSAARIDPRNVRRVIRALEVCLVTGRPFSEAGASAPPPWSVLRVGLTCDRAMLYERADRRIDQQITAGLVDEVRRLVAMGYGPTLPAMSSLGYREIGAHLRGELALDAAIERMKLQTHRFIRQQYTWFRPDDPAIRWLDINDSPTDCALAQAGRFLGDAAMR
jgi:tRNA dimethylallyltransferase